MLQQKNIYVIIIILLILFNGYYVYRFINSEKLALNFKDLSYSQKNIIELGKTKLPLNVKLNPQKSNKIDKDLSKEIAKNKFTLLVIFEPTSCGSCLGEATLWGEIKNEKVLPIIGVTSLKDSIELNNYLKNSNIEIPIYQDPNAVIGKYLEPKGIPAKILVNSLGEILFVDYVKETVEAQKRFKKMLYWYVK